MLNRMSILLKKPFQAKEKHVLTRKCQSFGGGQLGEGWWWWWWIIMFPGLSEKWGFLPDREAEEEVTISDSLHRWWPPSVNILIKMAVYLFSPQYIQKEIKREKKKKSQWKCAYEGKIWVSVWGEEREEECHLTAIIFFYAFSKFSFSFSSHLHPKCWAVEILQILSHNQHRSKGD